MKLSKLNLSNELAVSMRDQLLNKTASKQVTINASEKLIEDLNRCSEIFDELGNHKAAEIVTKILEKIASK